MRDSRPTRTSNRPASGKAPAIDGQAAAQQKLAIRIGAFAPEFRPAIMALAKASPAMQDLAESFPALLFALATSFGTVQGRRAARTAIIDGRSLREAAQALGLPFWMRKLPPQALQTAFPRVPAEPGLVTRLQSLIPAQPAITAVWLDRLLLAYHVGGPELALWVAQTYRASLPSATSSGFLHVLAWAWHADRPELRGARLLVSPWTRKLGLRRAVADAAVWRERIALDLFLGAGIEDNWLADGHANGFDFVALRTADDFFAEALAMDNCLDRYADRLSCGTRRIFSIRRAGRSIADVEISVHERELGMPAVSQLRMARNRRAPMAIWQATYAWLGAQPLRAAASSLKLKVGVGERRRRLEAFWQPFITALPDPALEAFTEAVMPKRGAARLITARSAPARSGRARTRAANSRPALGRAALSAQPTNGR